MGLSNEVQADLRKARVEVYYLSRAATIWWNSQRDPTKHTVAMFGGYYVVHDNDQFGPYKSPSAGLRDVYYRRVRKIEPPLMDRRELMMADRANKAKNAAKPKRIRKAKAISQRSGKGAMNHAT